MNRPTAWHEVVRLRDDLRTGELSLSLFAADLYDVVMGKAQPVYQNPSEFFALTYPTFNLRELAKDIALRLAGKNDKAVRQLELTYGGGKTHTLITLYHLTHDPRHLPDLPAVKEFTQHIGQRPPHARLAVLAFDKLDAEKGMEIVSPMGERRRLLHPWSVLAFQLAGSDGLRLLHASGEDAERESAPAEPLLIELLSIPVRQGFAPLILIDEVLMYVREKVGLEQRWRSTLLNFFQYLTQAATKVSTCAIVASLLATDPGKSDMLGKELTQELYAIFRREREEAVQPVVKEDVAEVLRRRFFTPESLRDPNRFRQHVAPIVQGIAGLDEQTQKDRQGAEERFLKNYPFHPDLTEVFYAKWTQLESFQRTRGILRTFALALRDAERWDRSPIVATNVFLNAPGETTLSNAARELTNVAETEEYEGKRQNWVSILEGELDKARELQREFTSLRHREIEQAVFATFLHSQPIGQKAQTRELLTLLGHTRPDKIEIERSLRRWIEISWFLDESAFQDAQTGQVLYQGLPGFWRLGSRPNLRQMHHDARERVAANVVEEKLKNAISACKSLTEGASPAGAIVHTLPEHPRDIADDGQFHYAVLGPKAASLVGRPSAEAIRFLEQKTGPDSPRVYRNALVLAVPLEAGLEAVRNAIRDVEGWLQVESQFKGKELDNNRRQLLEVSKKEASQRVVELVKQAYCVVVAIDAHGDIQAFKVVVGDHKSLFHVIKADPQARIQETAVTAEALLPEGPYNLWREGDTEHRVNDLVKAFAQFAHLPKMLKPHAIVDTLLAGCKQGTFVLRADRSDHSTRTYWYDAPDAQTASSLDLSVVLSEAAQLTTMPSRLLLPNVLPDLWHGDSLALGDLYRYFAGHTAFQQYEGYTELVAIPRAERAVVNVAISEAVKAKHLWLRSGQASLFGEEIPATLFTDEAILHLPPQAVAAGDLLPEKLPEAWRGRSETTALALADALSTQQGRILPWLTVREAITTAITARFLELAPGSARPGDFASASAVRLMLRGAHVTPPPPVAPTQPSTVTEQPPPYTPRPESSRSVLMAEATLETGEIQDLGEQVGEIKKRCTDYGLQATFHVRIDISGNATPEQQAALNTLLHEISDRLRLT